MTLHVGAGTFQPVRVDDVDAHVLHAERVQVGAAGLRGDRAHARCGRPGGGGRYDGRAGAGVRGARRCRQACALVWARRDCSSRRAFSFQVSRCAAHQLSSARVDAPHAGVRVCRARARACGLCARGAGALPLLQLRGRDVAHAGRAREAELQRRSDATARRASGVCSRAHGAIETPAFMPVGTYGTVKAMTPGGARGPRRADHPRQHLSPAAAPGCQDRSPRMAACTASCTGSARSSPIRAAFRSSASRACGRSPRRACASARRSTAVKCG